MFTDLAGWRAEWKRELENITITESQVVNEWISQGKSEGVLEERRRNLLTLLECRFPEKLHEDIQQLIQHQDSLELLDDWFKVLARAYSFEQFANVLKQ